MGGKSGADQGSGVWYGKGEAQAIGCVKNKQRRF